MIRYVLDIDYDRSSKLYKAVVLNRVAEDATTPVGRWSFGDPQMDWLLAKLAITYLKREEATVLMGNSCQKFTVDVPGWEFNADGQLVRI